MRGGLTVHGTTAVYARTLRRRAAANMLAATFAVVPVTLWWADHPTSPLRGVVAVLTVGVVAALVFDMSRMFDRANSGIVSEQAALSALRATSAEHVVCGATLKGMSGDVDQALLAPAIAAIEVKTGRGQVTARRGTLRCDGRSVHGSSLARSRAAAAELSRVAGSPAAAIVCVVGMSNDTFEAEGVTVCSERDLPAVVDALPPSRLTEDHVRGLAAELSRKGS